MIVIEEREAGERGRKEGGKRERDGKRERERDNRERGISADIGREEK